MCEIFYTCHRCGRGGVELVPLQKNELDPAKPPKDISLYYRIGSHVPPNGILTCEAVGDHPKWSPHTEREAKMLAAKFFALPEELRDENMPQP